MGNLLFPQKSLAILTVSMPYLNGKTDRSNKIPTLLPILYPLGRLQFLSDES